MPLLALGAAASTRPGLDARLATDGRRYVRSQPNCEKTHSSDDHADREQDAAKGLGVHTDDEANAVPAVRPSPPGKEPGNCRIDPREPSDAAIKLRNPPRRASQPSESRSGGPCIKHSPIVTKLIYTTARKGPDAPNDSGNHGTDQRDRKPCAGGR